MTSRVSWIAVLCLSIGISSIAPLNSQADETGKKKSIVFIAGGPSHDYGSHEHYAGCRILADAIMQTDPSIKCEVIRNGWPADDSALDNADAIVIYSDGGGGFPRTKVGLSSWNGWADTLKRIGRSIRIGMASLNRCRSTRLRQG